MNMKTFKFTIILITLFALLSSNLYSQSPKSSLGYFWKVVNSVDKKSDGSEWNKAAKGDALFAADQVRTREKSVAIIRFTKDNSTLRVLQNSELTMRADKDKRSRQNRIDNQGTIGFEINKLQNEEFTFTSPTSVASIRGTKGIFDRHNEIDMLIVKEGIVNFKNRMSEKEIDVGAGETGQSYPDGNLEKHKSTPDEINAVDNALKAGDKQIGRELKLELKDKNGDKKDLKIKYKE
jgi:hypothetical protein